MVERGRERKKQFKSPQKGFPLVWVMSNKQWIDIQEFSDAHQAEVSTSSPLILID